MLDWRSISKGAAGKGRQAIITQNIWLALTISAFGVYVLYASAAAVRRLGGARGYLHPDDKLIKGGFGLGAATGVYAVWALFVIPWLARISGLGAGYMALTAIAAPLLCIALAKRFWIARQLLRAGGPVQMLTAYFGRGGGALVWAALLVAVLLPLLALAMGLAGIFAAVLTGGGINRELGAILFALLLALSAAPSGLAASAAMGRVHGVMVIGGIIAIAAMAVSALGGLEALFAALAELPSQRPWGSTGGRGGGDFSHALAVAGGIRNFTGLAAAVGQGGFWTASLILSTSLAFAGLVFILLLPWLFAVPDPRSLQRHFLGAAGLWMGLVMFLPTLAVGIGGLFLLPSSLISVGVDEAAGAFTDASISATLAGLAGGNGWRGAIIGLTGLAALHAFAANLVLGLVSAAGGLWSRPGGDRPGDERQLGLGRMVALVAITGALLIALGNLGDLPHWGGLAVGLGVQLCVPFFGLCWFPALSRRALAIGPLAGFVAVLAATPLGHPLFSLAGGPAWPAWPLTTHPAMWGLLANLAASVLISVLDRDMDRRRERDEFHRRLAALSTPAEAGAEHAGAAWLAAAVWIFFALGPGTVIGNDIFGNPGLTPAEWDFGVPSILAWQILAWGSGLALLAYLGRRMGFTQFTAKQIEDIKNSGR